MKILGCYHGKLCLGLRNTTRWLRTSTSTCQADRSDPSLPMFQVQSRTMFHSQATYKHNNSRLSKLNSSQSLASAATCPRVVLPNRPGRAALKLVAMRAVIQRVKSASVEVRSTYPPVILSPTQDASKFASATGSVCCGKEVPCEPAVGWLACRLRAR